jgi:hypothetical protein
MPTKLLWKLPGVLLAAFSLVMLMTPALGIQFKPWFVEFLKELEDWEVTLFLQFITPHVLAAIDYLNASFDWHLKLAEWWHHAFVLLWLLHSSIARNMSRGEGWGVFLFMISWGGLTALVAGGATGTVPLNSVAMVLWPFAGGVALFAGLLAWLAALGRTPLWMPLMLAASATFFSYLGYAETNPITSFFFGFEVPSPGLLAFASLVVAYGIVYLMFGITVAARHFKSIDNPTTSVGLDIIETYGFAAAFAITGLYL